MNECMRNRDHTSEKEKIKAVTKGGKGTGCTIFRTLDGIQGFTPKEHREMMDREIQDKFVAEMRKNDRTWHWIEIIIILAFTACFTLLGAYIASPK